MGGDYYDVINGEDKDWVVVGDVSDHGIPSALLMATARAIIREHSLRQIRISKIATDVNRQLFEDVGDSGRFMTMFYVEVDRQSQRIHWLNAGSEPALVFPDNVDDTPQRDKT